MLSRLLPRPARAAALVLLAACSSGGGGGDGASDFRVVERLSIENARQRIVAVKLEDDATPPNGRVVISAIEDVPTGTKFDLARGPVFGVELRGPEPGGDVRIVHVPRDPLEGVEVPLDQVRLEGGGAAGSLRLATAAIPVPGSAQTLDVTVDVRLRPDGRSEWNVRADVSPGPLGVYAVRFPLLALAPIGPSGATNRLLAPFSSGTLLSDPVANGNDFPERGGDEASFRDALFTYPGSSFTQFLAYYDPSRAGLFIQAEDVRGTIKNVYFDADGRGSSRRLLAHFTHFNAVPSVGSGTPSAARAAAARSFDLAERLGYAMAVDTFRGDWVDAAALYRDWVTAARPFFLERGKLVDRAGVDPDLKLPAFAFRHQFSDAAPAIDVAEETEFVRRVLRFYEAERLRFDPERRLDFAPFVLAARYALDRDGRVVPDVPGESEPISLRPGLPDWLAAVRFPPASEPRVDDVSLNVDTSGFDPDSPIAAEAERKGVVVTSAFRPATPAPNLLRACPGSGWLESRRAALVLDALASSAAGGGAPGFSMVGLSGDGNFAYPCFAPGVDDPLAIDAAAHDHEAGGGSWHASGYARLAAALREGALGRFGVAPLLLGMEHEPETAVGDFLLNGRSLLPPYDDSTPGIGRTVSGSEPVPLFKLLYHDYALWAARVPAATAAVDLYVDGRHPLEDLLLIRYRTAQLAMQGRLLLVQFSREKRLAELEGPPDAIPAALQDEHRYVAALSVLRAALPEYLVFGRALRDPDVIPEGPEDSVPLRTTFRRVTRVESVPRVLASAWVDPSFSESAGLVATNFTDTLARVRFRFRPADHGLAPGARYRVESRRLFGPWTDAGFAFRGDDALVTSPPIDVAPLEDTGAEPWVILRFVAE